MAKKMLIDATHPEETRVVVADGNKVEEFDFESLNKRQLAGNIYLAKVTRVEPSLQAAFIEYGGNRHGFLAFSEIHPDYYQIPKADRDAIMADERALAEALAAEDDAAAARGAKASEGDANGDESGENGSEDGSGEKPKKSRSRSRLRSRRRKSGEEGDMPSDAESVIAEEGEDAVVAGDAAEVSEAASEAGSEGSDNGGDTDAPVTTIAESAGLEDETVSGDVISDETASDESTPDASAPAEPAGMETVDLGDGNDGDDPVEDPEPAPRRSRSRSRKRGTTGSDEGTGTDAGTASDDSTGTADSSGTNGSVETIGDDRTNDDVRTARLQQSRTRKYKIQEVVKVRQIMLVQVVKEERGNKGAALTTYLSLAGRYCVLMPNTARGGGISRKITNAVDRKKLKEIAQEIDVPQGAGLIVRTAGAKRTRTEIKRDYEYLQRQWEQVRELTLKSIAPAPIYEEGNLIHRSIRDLYSREIDEVIVEGEAGFREAKDYMRLIMPSHAKNVKLHAEPTPLFAKHGVESYLSSMFSPAVQLKSGGYIVIGTTEALVAIDVNSGKSTKEGSVEDTATKTNLEAADEVARQMRLRDLAGLIVIDFIDMDERRNNAAVEKRMKDALKGDRARIQMGRISGFGLMELSRQRLRPGMLEATTQACPHCHGTGLIRSDDSVALQVLRALEEEGGRNRSREVLARLPVKVVNYLMNDKREHLAAIEQRYGMAVRVEADPLLLGDDFPPLEKFKSSTRVIPKPSSAVHADTSWTSAEDDRLDAEAEAAEAEEAEEAPREVEAETQPQPGNGRDDNGEGDEGPRKKRRRRSRRRKNGGEGSDDRSDQNGDAEETAEVVADTGEVKLDESADAALETVPEVTSEEAAKPKSRSRSRSRAKKPDSGEDAAGSTEAAEATGDAEVTAAPEAEAGDAAPKPRSRSRSRAKPAAPEQGASDDLGAVAAVAEAAVMAEDSQPEPEPEPAPEPDVQPAAESEPSSEASEEDPAGPKPKRRGWWSFGS